MKMATVSLSLATYIDWKYRHYLLPPDSHCWSEEHNSLFGTDIFGNSGEWHGRLELSKLTLFAGMLLQDKDFVDGKREHIPQYPLVSSALRSSIIGDGEIDDHIMPWCRQVEHQLGDAGTNKIVWRPFRSPQDAKGWDQTRDFLMSLSRKVEYRKAVRNIKDLKVRHWFPPKNWLMHQHQDTKKPVDDILPLTFSVKHSLHHAGWEVHTGWKTWGPKALKVKLDGKNRHHSRGYVHSDPHHALRHGSMRPWKAQVTKGDMCISLHSFLSGRNQDKRQGCEIHSFLVCWYRQG